MPKLVVTVKDNVVMPRVRLAIRQLVGVERVFTLKDVSSTVKKGLLHYNLSQRISKLSQLADGLYGEDSKAIDSQCIKKLQHIFPPALRRHVRLHVACENRWQGTADGDLQPCGAEPRAGKF